MRPYVTHLEPRLDEHYLGKRPWAAIGHLPVLVCTHAQLLRGEEGSVLIPW